MKKRIIRSIIILIGIFLIGGVGFILLMNKGSKKHVESWMNEIQDSTMVHLEIMNTELRIREDSLLKEQDQLIENELERLNPSNSERALKITNLEEEALELVKKYSAADDAEKKIIEQQFRLIHNELNQLIH